LLFSRKTPLGEAQWVVVDCETSGLDARRDRLLSVAAVRVRGERIALEPSFAAVLRQAAPSAEANILVHGIGGEAQLAGRDPAEALSELRAFMGESFPAAFHAPFDAEVLRRAGVKPAKRWIDLAKALPALFPDRKARQLDDWLAAFAIECPARHDALADAWVTAQLLLVCLAEARRQAITTVEALQALEGAGRWIT
jgi:DNA polymerase-3 subunit epsilon